MKFSVIIPIYNMENYIESTINSIVLQEYQDFELILVNDGSTDNSLQICNTFSQKYLNIKVIDKCNTGSMDSWIVGVQNSSGDYLVFVDADDLLMESFFSVLDKYCNGENDVVIFDYYRMYKSKKIHVKTNSIEYGYYDADKLDFIKNNVISNPLLFSFYRWNKAVKREIIIDSIKEIKCRSVYFEDHPIGYLTLLYSNNINYINDALYLYRMRKSSISHKVKEKIFYDNLIIKQQMESIIRNHTNNKNDLVQNNLYFAFQYCRWYLKADFNVPRIKISNDDIRNISGRNKKMILFLYKYHLKWLFLFVNWIRHFAGKEKSKEYFN